MDGILNGLNLSGINLWIVAVALAAVAWFRSKSLPPNPKAPAAPIVAVPANTAGIIDILKRFLPNNPILLGLAGIVLTRADSAKVRTTIDSILKGLLDTVLPQVQSITVPAPLTGPVTVSAEVTPAITPSV